MELRTPSRQPNTAPRTGLRSSAPKRSRADRALTALECRIAELEQLASSQTRELRIQFERIAQLQAEYDVLRIRGQRRDPNPAQGVSPRDTKVSAAPSSNGSPGASLVSCAEEDT